MDNSYFILSKQNIEIQRFHICTWDIQNTRSFVMVVLSIILVILFKPWGIISCLRGKKK
jgi:hypothetical protein